MTNEQRKQLTSLILTSLHVSLDEWFEGLDVNGIAAKVGVKATDVLDIASTAEATVDSNPSHSFINAAFDAKQEYYTAA